MILNEGVCDEDVVTTDPVISMWVSLETFWILVFTISDGMYRLKVGNGLFASGTEVMVIAVCVGVLVIGRILECGENEDLIACLLLRSSAKHDRTHISIVSGLFVDAGKIDKEGACRAELGNGIVPDEWFIRGSCCCFKFSAN